MNYGKVASPNVKRRPFEFLLAGSGGFRPLMSMGIPLVTTYPPCSTPLNSL